ncbi:hypothetical protein HK100_007715, partial [Physocladia obscura]
MSDKTNTQRTNDPPSLPSLTESEAEHSSPHDSRDSLGTESDSKSQSPKTQPETTTTTTATNTSHSAITAALLALIPRDHIQLPRRLTPRTSGTKSVVSQKEDQQADAKEQQEQQKRKVHFSEPLVSFTITHSKSEFDDVISLLSVDAEFELPIINTDTSDNNDFDIDNVDDLRDTLALDLVLEPSDTSSSESSDNGNDNDNEDRNTNNINAVPPVSPAAESAPQNISQPRRGLRRAVSKATRPFVDELDFLRATRDTSGKATTTTTPSSSVSPATPPRSILKVGLPLTNAAASVSPNRIRRISTANSSSLRRSSTTQHGSSNSLMMLSLNSLSPSTTGAIRSAQFPHARGRMPSSPTSTSGSSPPPSRQLTRSSSSSALNRKKPTHISKTGYEQRA